MRKGNLRRRRTCAAAIVMACAGVTQAATPAFNSGTVTITHDVDITNSSTAAGVYKSISLTPPSSMPGSFQLNDSLSENSGGVTVSSVADTSVALVQNSTTATVTLAAGTGVTQTASSHVVKGAASLRVDLNNLTWTPNATFGPPGTGYFSIALAGTVGSGGYVSFGGQLNFTDQSGNHLCSTLTLGTSTFTTSSSLPHTFTATALFSPSALASTSKIKLSGYLLFQTKNDDGSSVDPPFVIDAGSAPPTATFYGNGSTSWTDPANWTPPAGSSDTFDPDHIIPTVPDGVDVRARFADADPTVTLSKAITLGTLDVDQPDAFPLTINGAVSTSLVMQTSCSEVPAAIEHRNVQGNSPLIINVPVVLNSDLQLDENTTGGVQFNGGIVANGHNITKSGAGPISFNSLTANSLTVDNGTVTLVGSGVFNNVTITNTGTLAVGVGSNSGLISGPIKSDGALVFNRSGSSSYTGIISGGGTLIKNGSGTLILSGAVSTYTGDTFVNSGTLITAGAVLNGTQNINVSGLGSSFRPGANTIPTVQNINLINGGILDLTLQPNFATPGTLTIKTVGSGTIQGNVLHSAGTISPGGDQAASNLSMNGSLTIAGGAINFDLSPLVGSGNDQIAVAGPVNFTSGTINVDFYQGNSAVGTYQLLSATNTTGTAANLTLVNNSRAAANLTSTPAGLFLNVSAPASSASLIWSGAGANNWDVGTSQNWSNSSTLTPDHYFNHDTVTFDDNGASVNVNITSAVQPASVVVNSSTNNYTFAGNGTITGSGGLTKSGNSALEIDNFNTYTGPTQILGGTLIAARLADGGLPSSLGASTNAASNLILNGGALRFVDGLSYTTDRLFTVGPSGGTIGLNGASIVNFTNPGGVVLNGNLTLGAGNGGEGVLAASMSGAGAVSKDGARIWTLTGNNTYTGGTEILDGTLTVNGSIVGAVTNGNTGALAGTGVVNGEVDVANSGRVSPGYNAPGQLTVGTAMFQGGNLDIALDSGQASSLLVTNDNGLIINGTLLVTANDLGAAAPGTYPIIQYNGVPFATLANLALASATLGDYTLSLTQDSINNAFDLVVQGATGNFLPAGGSNWSSPTAWAGQVPNGLDAVANFSDTGGPVTFHVDTPQTIGALNINSSNPYNITGPGTLTFAGNNAVSINVLAGSHTIAAPVVLTNGTTVNVAPATSTLAFTGPVTSNGGGIDKIGAGTATFVSMNVQNLTIESGMVKIQPQALPNSSEGTSVVTALSIASGAKLDLSNNSMVIDYISQGCVAANVLDQVRQYIKNGQLIASSHNSHQAVGYADNAVLNLPVFAGQTVDSSSVLLKFTYLGDANLDGQVDVTDLGELASNWQASGTWISGDFNYDGKVDVTDLGILATNWQQGVGNPLALQSFHQALEAVGLGSTTVPEPAAIAAMLMLCTWPLKRPRR